MPFLKGKRHFYEKQLYGSQIVQWFSFENQQSHVYDMKWGHFDREYSTFKMLLSSWNFDTVFKKIGSLMLKIWAL